MARPDPRPARPLLPIALLLALAACSPSAPPGPDDGPSGLRAGADVDVLFLTRDDTPRATMEALFEGRVARDDAGCLRLGSPAEQTVIWPKGHELAATPGGELAVLDPEGRTVGRIGGRFRLAGGEVERLHEGTGMSEADRQAARDHCPGRYWIVGETL